MKSAPKLLIAAPLLAALAFVLSIYVDRGQVLEALPRPLAVASIAILSIQLLAIAVTRRAAVGTAIALLALIAVIDPRLFVATALIWLIARELSRRRRWAVSWQAVRTPIAVIFVATVVRLAFSPAFAPEDLIPRASDVRASSGNASPDIFLIMLDGYPRSDTLASFGYDNAWFETELRDRGFTVARRSHSNYEFTYVVIPTLFHMRHAAEIDELREAGDGWVAQRRAMRAAIASAPSFPLLREKGYEIVSAGADATPLSLSPVASYIDQRSVTQFERELLDSTVLGQWFPSFALNQHRARVMGTFEATEAVASDPRQTLMFAHVLSPHVPIVFDRAGHPPPPCVEPCNPYGIYVDESGMTQEQFRRAYTDQVHYLNGRILVTLDRIIANSPDAPIVLFSDHGTRAERELSHEWFDSFFASRTPGHQLFGDTARPIEILPVLFNAYLGQSLPIPSDETYYSPLRGTRPLDLEPWPGDGP